MGASAGTSACVFRELDSCWPNLALGDLVEIELVAPYVEGGPYPWVSYAGTTGSPSCERRDGVGRDGFGVGTYPFELVDRTGTNGCWEFAVLPRSPIGELVFGVQRGGGGFLTSHARSCGEGRWRMVVMRLDQEDRDPFGEEWTPGGTPPLIVRRELTDDCGPTPWCADAWVSEIRRLDPPSTDAGPPEGGP